MRASRVARAVGAGARVGLLVGLVGVVLSPWPGMLYLESELGLDWLFHLRGPRQPPEEVVIVAIDESTHRTLGLPRETSDWTRSIHARLVRRLHRSGAKVVAFDVEFQESRDEPGDADFASALTDYQRVVLFQSLTQPSPGELGDNGLEIAQQIRREKLRPIVDRFASAAAGIGPFPLPKVPVRVSQFWLFKRGAGDVPTLPVVALTVFADSTVRTLMKLLAKDDDHPGTDGVDGHLEILGQANHLTASLRQSMLLRPNLASRIVAALDSSENSALARQAPLMRALLDVLAGSDHRFIDFYGPPYTIRTISYQQALEDPPPDLAGKAVFVGASTRFQPDQQDGFFTVFSRSDGVDISGVEIAATAFANLIERREVKPLSALRESMLLLAWGVLLGAVLRPSPMGLSIVCGLLLAIGYVAVADSLFSRHALWLPMLTPLLIQLPLAVGLSLYLRYRHSREDQARLQATFSRYLPPTVVKEIASQPGVRGPSSRVVNGVCLATDAEKYTSLGERTSPRELHELLNRYFQVLFRPVETHGGFVSDVVGDAMVALWVATADDTERRRQACLAALEIVEAVRLFNQHEHATPLPTRVGLHCGEIALGDVGAGEHYEYRAVGDMVNTASRLEGLNKQLGTWILASGEVVRGIADLPARDVGSFRVVGRRQFLEVYELLPPERSDESGNGPRFDAFAAGLGSFRKGAWKEAEHRFQSVLANYPSDGPSRYYRDLARRFDATPPGPDWDGVVTLDRK